MRVMWWKWGLITRCTCEGYVGKWGLITRWTCEGYVGEVGVDYEVYM